MKKINRLSIFLAAAIQLAPICRTVCTSPAASSAFAIIMRWTIGTAATLGVVDAMSGATTVVFTTPTNFNGTVGTYFTNFVAITNNGSDPGAYFYLNNSNTLSPQLINNVSTTNCMPKGLTFTMHDGGSPRYIYGAIYGTPTVPVTNLWVHIQAGYPKTTPAVTDIYFTFVPASAVPVITNQPVSRTNLAGSTGTFTVTAGPPPVGYQWRFNTNTVIAGATNATLTLTNIHLVNDGYYMAIITNNGGAVTSSVARLTVTVPPAPVLNLEPPESNLFKFSFNPIAGLTNTVQTNDVINVGGWGVLTNIAPPANTNTITVTNPITGLGKYYRVIFSP